MSRFSPLALLTAVFAFAGCPPVATPEANVVVALPGGDCGSGIVADGGTLCVFDFGTVSSSVGVQQSFEVDNRGAAPANIAATLTSGDPSFTILSVTSPIAPGAKGAVVVKVVPVGTDQIEDSLVVAWDPPSSDINIDLKATGDGALPHLSVNPGSCDLGAVGVGASSTCTLTLADDGAADLVINAITLADNPGGVFAITPAFPPSTTVAAGSSTTVTLTGTPVNSGDTVAHLLIASNDPTNAQARISLTVQGQ